MTEPELLSSEIAQVLERFPDKAAVVSRLLVDNEAFRVVCQEYALARSTLVRLEAQQEAREPLEIADYRTLVAELEKEIAGAIGNAK